MVTIISGTNRKYSNTRKIANILPISAVNSVVGSDGKIIDNNTLKAISQQLDEFIFWSSLQPQLSNQ